MTFSERFAAWAERVPYKFTKYKVVIEKFSSVSIIWLQTDTLNASIMCRDQDETAHFSIKEKQSNDVIMTKSTTGANSFMWSFSVFFGHLGINVQGCQPLLPGLPDLKIAIDDVLGTEKSAKIRCSLQVHNSPYETTKWMHLHASAKAFADHLTGNSVEVLREMLVYLNEHGNYPIDSWEMTCR